jgi:hypothetical protein
VSGNDIETTEEADERNRVCSIVRHVIRKGSAENTDIVRVLPVMLIHPHDCSRAKDKGKILMRDKTKIDHVFGM